MDEVRIYRELAEQCDQRGEAQSRDRYLVLAADAAQQAGDQAEAERLRQRLLQVNPHHLLKPFSSFGQALQSRDVSDYIKALRRRHPVDQAATLLQTMPAAKPVEQPVAAPPAAAPRIAAPAIQKQAAAEFFRIQQPLDSAPTQLRQRPSPPAPGPAAASNAGRLRTPPAEPPRSAPRSLPPLPLPAQPQRPAESSPFRPPPRVAPPSVPAYPIYQGPREATSMGAWLCSFLFVLILLGGIGLAVCTLGRPFLPNNLVPTRILPSRD
jgi:hypothetical protein